MAESYSTPPYHAPHMDEPCSTCGWGETAQLLTRLDCWVPAKLDDIERAQDIISAQLANWRAGTRAARAAAEVDRAAQHHREITREDPSL